MRVAVVLLAFTGCARCHAHREEACTPPAAPRTGEATFYAADGTGACSFDASPDRMIAAISGADYAHAAWCGACLEVTGPTGATVTVRVVDSCPACAPGGLDLSAEAFGKLAPPATGRISITWREVDCDVQGPLAYRFDDAAIQIRNHRYPIARVERRGDDGAYHALERADHNFFFPSSPFVAPLAIRITDTRGHIVEDTVTYAPSTTRTAAKQLPACPRSGP